MAELGFKTRFSSTPVPVSFSVASLIRGTSSQMNWWMGMVNSMGSVCFEFWLFHLTGLFSKLSNFSKLQVSFL